MLLTKEDLRYSKFRDSIWLPINDDIRYPIIDSLKDSRWTPNWYLIENSIIFFIYIPIMNSVNLSICRRLKNATN